MNATDMVQGNLALKLETPAAYAESASNVTYETVRVQSGDSLWSLAQEHSVDGLSTQETSDIIRSVNHLEHGSLDAGDVLKVPARS